MNSILSYTHRQQIPLRCTKWPPKLKIEISCRLSQVKLLVRFQPNFTVLISTIPSYVRCVHRRHVKLCCKKWLQDLEVEKNLVRFHRTNYWWDFNQTLQEWSVPSLVEHIACKFRFTAQNGRHSLKYKYCHRSNYLSDFNQTSGSLMPAL
jgi:hypothetical protein